MLRMSSRKLAEMAESAREWGPDGRNGALAICTPRIPAARTAAARGKTARRTVATIMVSLAAPSLSPHDSSLFSLCVPVKWKRPPLLSSFVPRIASTLL